MDRQALKEILANAAGMTPAARAPYLDAVCAGDAALRQEIHSLLAACDRAPHFLTNPTAGPEIAAAESADAMGPAPATETHPVLDASLGPYRLLEQIGEGGFGTVYLAEQREPVQRRVAMKVIKLGMDTQQVIARFEAERQALAMMDHPNIARVLDGGATDAQSPLGAGRPYFVMELVRGVPITQFCDDNRLTPRERLTLFADVCHAVQHAHQKGVIHRDLKPSNVLVSRYDDKPVVKVIDFGIAKAVSGRLTDKTLFTELRQLIGTPAYMSPEQAGLSDLDIDTRSDIYSLGVLLYELLTGTTPFEPQRLRSADYDVLRRIIREEEPLRPSMKVASGVGSLRTPVAPRAQTTGTPKPRASSAAPPRRTIGVRPLSGRGAEPAEPRARASGSDSSAAAIAAARHTDPRSLVRLLRGDLDWITMKCLEKDRQRRYETANGLAADVRRHLAGEPVMAAPPSVLYRVSRFVRRHKAAVMGCVAMGTALVVGALGLSAGLVQAVAARAEESKHRIVAQKQQKRAEAMTDFVSKALRSSDSLRGGEQDILVGDAMLKAVEEIDSGAFRGDPEIEAALLCTISEVLNANGRSVEALPLAERALAIRQRLESGGSAEEARVLHALARVRQNLKQLAEAEALFVQSLATRRRLFEGDNADVAQGLSSLAWLYVDEDRLADAEPLAVQAHEVYQRLHPGDHKDVAASLGIVAHVRLHMGMAAEAESLFLRALEMDRRLYPGDHYAVAVSLANLAEAREVLGRFEDAESLYQQALGMIQRVMKGDHPGVALMLSHLASTRGKLGKLTEAEELYTRALEMRRRIFKGDHADLVDSLDDLARLRNQLGRAAEAEPLAEEALRICG